MPAGFLLSFGVCGRRVQSLSTQILSSAVCLVLGWVLGTEVTRTGMLWFHRETHSNQVHTVHTRALQKRAKEIWGLSDEAEDVGAEA